MRQPQGRRSSQSYLPGRSSESSPWQRDSSPFPGSSLSSGRISSDMDTQDLRDGVEAYANRRVQEVQRAYASGGNAGGRDRREVPDGDHGTDVDNPSKRRKVSPTQPGRGIRKIVDLYHNVADLLQKAQQHSFVVNESNQEEMNETGFTGRTEDDIEEERKDRKRCHTALKLLNSLIPGFEREAGNAKCVITYCSSFQNGANDARSDDTSRLKVVVADWLNNRSESTPENRLSSRGKDERGINNDITGRLLCPIDYDWDDPYVRAKLRDADPGYNFTSNFFLQCLYEGERGDPDSPDVGFLKGPLLIRTYQHIFTAPSSASEDGASEPRSRRRDVATGLRLNGHVTARSIAYAATQLVFSLTSAKDWKKEHAGFHYPSFYNFIVDFFEDTQDSSDSISTTAVTELLQWWNCKIFPASSRQSGGLVSRNALRSSQRRIQESRARQARA